MKKLCFILGVLFLTSCYGNYRQGGESSNSTTTNDYNNEVNEPVYEVHQHTTNCVSIYCDDGYSYKDIYVKNVCDHMINSVKIKYRCVPENPISPGVSTATFNHLSPGKAERITLSCNGHEVSVIIQDIIIR